MQFRVESFTYNELLSIRGWLFDTSKCIERAVVSATHKKVVDKRELILGFTRQDVYESFVHEKSLHSGFYVTGLQVGKGSQIDLKVYFSDGTFLEKPIALFYLTSSAGLQSLAPKLISLSPNVATNLMCNEESVHNIFFKDLVKKQKKTANKSNGNEPVNVLVSVYKGIEYLEPFFTSLFEDPGFPCDVTVVDNGNVDAKVTKFLSKVKGRYQEKVRLIRVKENEGYIKGISTAYKSAPGGRHVVVLNTDLSLPRNWLLRLIDPILTHNDIATVTPFTNSGSVCSFPIKLEDNDIFRDLPLQNIDKVFSDFFCSEGGPDIPSGVGFCMAHNKDVVAKIGFYDTESFGFGYGEENDWCLKAKRLGYRNILSPNLFVWHKHGGIYMPQEKRDLINKNMQTILARFPEYQDTLEEHGLRDFTSVYRIIAAARLAMSIAYSASNVLVDSSIEPSPDGLTLKESICGNSGVCIWIEADSQTHANVYIFVSEISGKIRVANHIDLMNLVEFIGVKNVRVFKDPHSRIVQDFLSLIEKNRSFVIDL